MVDGMADYPVPQFNNLTPLQQAVNQTLTFSQKT
jgi:2,3-bisphosphoglycerate-independent phosphoglycerate mutase